MTNDERRQIIIDELTRKFAPNYIEVIDVSHEHIGHAGAASGAGHFDLVIDKTCFGSLSRLQIHKAIYEAIGYLIPSEVHAISITLRQ